jgi:hypothetical protein
LPRDIPVGKIHPWSGNPLSVAPLTWSHAQVISVVRNYLDRLAILRATSREKTPGTHTQNERDSHD